MSECIVRMEMPKRCDLCDFWSVCKNVADFGKARYFEEPRELAVGMKGCKIVCQLPEEHGRLIDADSMAKDLNYDVELDAKALDDMSIVGYARERFQFDKNRKQDCIRYLSGQKTIVPAEAESPSPKPTDPLPIRDVYYVMTECDVKTGTVTYEPRERIEL